MRGGLERLGGRTGDAWGGNQDSMRWDFMRAFYSTQRHFRVFILGTPEGWHVSVYDLHKHEWLEKDGTIEETLKTAKATAHEKVSLLLGKNTPELKWH